MLRGVKACVVFSLVVVVVLDRWDMPERGMQPVMIIPVDGPDPRLVDAELGYSCHNYSARFSQSLVSQ